MARPIRRVVAGGCYHVLNRGNGRMTIFHKDGDYLAFLRVLAEGLSRYPVDLLDWCLMPNQWHLVLRPRKPDALAGLMRWVCVTHVRRHHEHYGTRGGGHLYQGRFKSFPIQQDRHFLTVCRYVEANAVRAGLVRRAEAWRWCSVGWEGTAAATGSPTDATNLDVPPALAEALRLAEWPVARPRGWAALVNERLPAKVAAKLQQSLARGRPFGADAWTLRTAAKLGLRNTVRPVGRPRKNQ